MPDGQYAPAGHAQRYGDRGEGLFDAALRCHEYPQIDDVFTFDAVNTVSKTQKGKVHSQSTQGKKEEKEPCSIYIYTVAGKEGKLKLHAQTTTPASSHASFASPPCHQPTNRPTCLKQPCLRQGPHGMTAHQEISQRPKSMKHHPESHTYILSNTHTY